VIVSRHFGGDNSRKKICAGVTDGTPRRRILGLAAGAGSAQSGVFPAPEWARMRSAAALRRSVGERGGARADQCGITAERYENPAEIAANAERNIDLAGQLM
jgi:hypothetical protein